MDTNNIEANNFFYKFSELIKLNDIDVISKWDPRTRDAFANGFNSLKRYYKRWENIEVSSCTSFDEFSLLLVKFSNPYGLKPKIWIFSSKIIKISSIEGLIRLLNARYRCNLCSMIGSILTRFIFQLRHYMQPKIIAYVYTRIDNKNYLAYPSSCIPLLFNDIILTYKNNYVSIYNINGSSSLIKEQENNIINEAFEFLADKLLCKLPHYEPAKVYNISSDSIMRKLSSRSMFVEPANNIIINFREVVSIYNIIHEIVHYVFNSTCKTWPRMVIREGIAEAFHNTEYYLNKMKSNDIFNYKCLFSDFLFNDGSEGPPLYAGLFCKYIHNKIGINGILKMYSSISGTEKEIATYLNLTTKSMEKDFINWLRITFGIKLKKKCRAYLITNR